MRLKFKLFTVGGESILFLKVYASFAPADVRTLPLAVGDVPFSVEWDVHRGNVEWSSCVYVMVCTMIKQKPVITACGKCFVWGHTGATQCSLIDYATGVVKGALAYSFEDIPSLPMTEAVAMRQATDVALANGAVPVDAAAALDDEMHRRSREHFSYADLEAFVREYTARMVWNVPPVAQLIAEELARLPTRSFTSLIGWPVSEHIYFRVSPAFYLDGGIFEDFLAMAITHMGATRASFLASCSAVLDKTSTDVYDAYLVLNVLILACSYPSLMSRYASDYASVRENGTLRIIDTERFTILAAALFVGDCEELAKYIAFMFEAARSSDRTVTTPLFAAIRPFARLYIAGGALMTATLPSMDAAKRAAREVQLSDTTNVTGHMATLFVQRWRVFNEDTGVEDPDPPEFELRTVYPGFGEGTGDLDADMTPLGEQDAADYKRQCEVFAGSALERWDLRLPNAARTLSEDVSVNNFYRYLFLFLPCSRQPLPVTFFIPMTCVNGEDGTGAELVGCTIPDLINNYVIFRPAHRMSLDDNAFMQIILSHLPGETGPERAVMDAYFARVFARFVEILAQSGLGPLDVETEPVDNARRVVLHKMLSDVSEVGFRDSVERVKQLGAARAIVKNLVLTPTRVLLLLVFDLPNSE